MAYTSEFLRITKEAAWGVYDSTPDPGDQVLIQLDQPNAFTMRERPLRWSIRTASSNNRRLQTGSAKKGYEGGLQTLLYPSQAALLLNWGCTLDGNTGQAYSCTIDHVITMEDAMPTLVYARYLGVKVAQLDFNGDAESQLMRLRLALQAKSRATITATDFPTPDLDDYPSDAPYLFEHLNGALTLNGSPSEFNNFNLTVKNILDGTFNASSTITRLKNCGRDVDFSTRLVYQRTIDRASFEGVSAVTAQAVFSNGGHSITFDMKAKNFYDQVNDNLPFDKVKYQELRLQAYLDGAAGDDFAVTFA